MRPPDSGVRPDASAARGAALLVALATLAAFWGATANGFVTYDDDAYVTDNVWVREGLSWAGVHWAFTTFHEGNWHPATWLSHMLDVSLFGLDPFGHHLTSVALHALTAALLLLFLHRATGRLGPSALAAALFALHPMQVEPVAWVAERKEVLCGAFWMLALHAHLAHARRPGPRRRLALLGCAALALLSKPTAMTLPAALLLVDFWPLDRLRPPVGASRRPAARAAAALRGPAAEKAVLFAMSGACLLVTLRAQTLGGAVGSLETYPPAVRAANVVTSFAWYLLRSLWPAELAPIYAHPRALPPAWQLLGGGALLGAATLAALASVRRRPALATGWLWFLVALVPVSGIVQVGLQSRADRYLHLPLAGLCVCAAFLGGRGGGRGARRGPRLTAPALAALAALAAASRAQIAYWRDGTSALQRAVDVSRDNWVAHLNLAIVLEKLGRAAEAAPHYEAMRRIKRELGRVHAERGVAFPGAREAPADAGTGRAAEFCGAAREHLARGRFDAAADACRAALAQVADFPPGLNNLGVALAGLGERDRAAELFRAAQRAAPRAAAPWLNLGNVQLLQGDFAAAEASFRASLSRERDSVAARLGLADALLARGRRYRALFEYREALRLDPGSAAARRRLRAARAAGSARVPAPLDPEGATDFALMPCDEPQEAARR